MPALPLRRFTPEEYLLIERAAEYRSEYYGGEIYAMSGGSLRHATIADNCLIAVSEAADRRGCRAYRADVRVRVGRGRAYFYPDVMVVCGKPRLTDEHRDTVENPAVVLEGAVTFHGRLRPGSEVRCVRGIGEPA